MPILYYRDPADQQFKPLIMPGAETGPGEVFINSVEPIETSIELWLNPDEGATVTGFEAYDERYVRRSGSRLEGHLALANDPVDGDHVATKRYVDSVVTVSTTPPSGPPARDGLVWIVA